VHQQTLIELSEQANQQWVGMAGFGDPAKVPDDQLSAGVASLRIAFAWVHSKATLWTGTLPQD
jgi:hypothetical protein